jgi:CRISPR-associated protein Csm3
MALKRKIRVETRLKLLSGLHIGDSRERTDIGGIDNPVIRRKDTQQPYIPGSSIKGKIRSLLEQIDGISEIGGGRMGMSSKSDACNHINTVFGFANDDKPSRVIFRDAYLTDDSVKMLGASEYTDMPYTEAKSENSIDRVKGKAENPRTQERVPAGAEFNIEFIINDFDDYDLEKVKATLVKGIQALNNDYLGGSGSRGSGHIYIALPGEKDWKETAIEF